jgi:hypothetical protein
MSVRTFRSHAFHPKAEYCFTRLSFSVGGFLIRQVFWLAISLNTFPSVCAGQWFNLRTFLTSLYEFGVSLTATGIAPDLHRTSLLIRQLAKPNRCKCMEHGVNRFKFPAWSCYSKKRSTTDTTNHDGHNGMFTFVVSVVIRCVRCAPFLRINKFQLL